MTHRTVYLVASDTISNNPVTTKCKSLGAEATTFSVCTEVKSCECMQANNKVTKLDIN
jgi:hypothetical protein